MSRAFVKEDGGAWGDPGSIESATGYHWGERRLRHFVEKFRERAEREGDERLAQPAERFLR